MIFFPAITDFLLISGSAVLHVARGLSFLEQAIARGLETTYGPWMQWDLG